jgi:hypothetical protein
VVQRLEVRGRRRAPGARRDGRLHARQGGLPPLRRPGRRRHPHSSARTRRQRRGDGSSSEHEGSHDHAAGLLKAAAEFGAARPNLKSGDVLAIAASWERWITREQETTYDLDAADDDAAF